MAEAVAAIIAGPPSSVAGLVPFHNGTQAAITIDEVVIRDTDGESTTMPMEPVTVPAGQTAHIGVTLNFQPQTAPGTHALEVEMQNVVTAVIAHIAESREIDISPEALIIDNVPGGTVSRDVVVANQGNTSAFVADFGDIPLYREDESLATALAISRTNPELVPSRFDAFPEPAATLAIATEGGRVEVLAGESRIVSLTLTVPEDLPQSSRYLAVVPIGVRTLLLAVVPAGPDPKES